MVLFKAKRKKKTPAHVTKVGPARKGKKQKKIRNAKKGKAMFVWIRPLGKKTEYKSRP